MSRALLLCCIIIFSLTGIIAFSFSETLHIFVYDPYCIILRNFCGGDGNSVELLASCEVIVRHYEEKKRSGTIANGTIRETWTKGR